MKDIVNSTSCSGKALVFGGQGLMDHELRNKRLRLLVSKINKERKRQAKKVDILCNDLVAAQKDFLKRLDTISFAANFYESIVEVSDLKNLLGTSAKLMGKQIDGSNICFFVRQNGSFDVHVFESTNNTNNGEEQALEGYFTEELVKNVCKSNKVCDLDDLLQIGLVGNPVVLKKVSVATVPLEQTGTSVGFILIWRRSEDKLSADELTNICTVTQGLSKAIASRLVTSHFGK